MRKLSQTFMLTLLVIASICTSSFAQEVHTITLFVNTAEVSSQNTSITCDFGQTDGVSNEDFTIRVKKGDIIVWKGVSSNAPETDIVDIKAINHEGGVNIFNKNVLRGNGQSPEVVIGTIVQGVPGDEEKYKVSFKVFNNGTQRRGAYQIDPKIQLH